MATLKAGQVGIFNGKIGTVVVSKWKQLLVGRGAPGKRTKPGTATQMDQQSRFALITNFIAIIGNVIKIGYKDKAVGNYSAHNMAVRYHLANAVTGVFPDYEIDYPKVVVSSPSTIRDIDAPLNPELVEGEGNSLILNWEVLDRGFEAEEKAVRDTDMMAILAYDVTNQRVYFFRNLAQRSSLTHTFISRSIFQNKVLAAYVFFISADGKTVSKSEYTGMIDFIVG